MKIFDCKKGYCFLLAKVFSSAREKASIKQDPNCS